MLGEKGFNELDLNLLKHLIHNKKPLVFIRTQCDSATIGVQNKFEDDVSMFCSNRKLIRIQYGSQMSFDQAMDQIKTTFDSYIKTSVLTKVELKNIGEYINFDKNNFLQIFITSA